MYEFDIGRADDVHRRTELARGKRLCGSQVLGRAGKVREHDLDKLVPLLTYLNMNGTRNNVTDEDVCQAHTPGREGIKDSSKVQPVESYTSHFEAPKGIPFRLGSCEICVRVDI